MEHQLTDADKWRSKIAGLNAKITVYSTVEEIISDIINTFNLGPDKNGVDDLTEANRQLDAFYRFAFEYFVERRLQEAYSADDVRCELNRLFVDFKQVNF